MSAPHLGSAGAPGRTVSRWKLPDLGVGLGLRGPHIGDILARRPEVGWFEIITENFLVHRGYLAHVLDLLAERYPIVLHGVSLSIGSTEPLDRDYLRAVKTLAERVGAPWVSDHVCWTGVGGRNSHDLLPVPYNREMLDWMVARVRRVQDLLERPLILENPSSYVEFADSPISEWDFIAELAERADCGLLLDVNNIYVSSVNHDFDPHDYLRAVPWDRVAQFHVAGHTDRGTHILDTHIGPVIEAVWELFGRAWELSGGRSVLLEWDAEIPDFDTVWAEARKAERWMAERGGERSGGGRERPRAAATDPAEPPAATEKLLRWTHEVVADDPGARWQEVGEHIRPNDRLTAEERVRVYTRMVAVRLHEAMLEDYPTVARLLEDDFRAAVAAYCREHPSTSWALEHLGRHFPDWLSMQVEAARRGERLAWAADGLRDGVLELLADVAALEWALVDSHLADRSEALSAEDFAAVPAETRPLARFRLAPSVRLVRADRPVHHLVFEGTDPGGGDGEPEWVLVFREALQVHARVLDPLEAGVLGELLGGATMQDAVLTTVGDHRNRADELLEALPEWTKRWARSGLIVGIDSGTAQQGV